MPERVRVLVVGAGPAGLAASQQLQQRGIAHRVLERGDTVGYTWANLYDSLTLHTGKHMSSLPGLAFPRSAPLFLPRREFWEYLRHYARTFTLPVETACTVEQITRADGAWTVGTNRGPLDTAILLIATGIVANPRIPRFPGQDRFRGPVIHSVAYQRPAPYVGRRVLIVGVGNSGAEIGSEIAAAGGRVTIAVRSGANVVPLTLAGLPIQYIAYWVRKLPRKLQEGAVALVRLTSELRRGPPVLPRPAHSPLDAIPVIGFHLVDAICAGLIDVRAAVAELTAEGARFTDGTEGRFDEIILATGFAAALGPLGSLIQLDPRGFARRRDRVVSLDQAGLYFVGHNYDATGGLFNINRDARLAAKLIASALARS
ncbi:MAG TPA: NAD(P)/FAD-dependent oxidoreductase [Gemmatimonadales bacterium]|nr:NAD(P)/FAD-dependent oxidoreductase [Gemmatimonadales bacterium]